MRPGERVPVDARIDQIRVPLERARWVFHAVHGRFVLVDIAGFEVGLREEGGSIWTCRAQVGKPYRETPVFRSDIKYLVLCPTWTIPPGILPHRKKTFGSRSGFGRPGRFSGLNFRSIWSGRNAIQ